MVLDLSYFSIPVAVKWCHCQIVATCRHQHAEGGLLGYARSPHPEILLKIAIAWNDGGPTIGWVAGLYTKKAFDLLKWIHEKIAASALAECDAQDFYGAFREQAGPVLRISPYRQHSTSLPSVSSNLPVLCNLASTNSWQALSSTLRWQLWRRATTRPRDHRSQYGGAWHHRSQIVLAGC